MGQVEYKILYPDRKVLGANTISADNELGIVGRLNYGNFDVFMAADISSTRYLPEKILKY